MSSKNFAVKKLLGYNNTDLCISSITAIALFEVLAFALSSIVLSIMLFSEINNFYKHFIKYLKIKFLPL